VNFRIPACLQMDVEEDRIFYFRKCGSQTHVVPGKGGSVFLGPCYRRCRFRSFRKNWTLRLHVVGHF
jgi:hypothetical protein